MKKIIKLLLSGICVLNLLSVQTINAKKTPSEEDFLWSECSEEGKPYQITDKHHRVPENTLIETKKGTMLCKNGAIVTGWQWFDDGWYYFNSEGIMQTGWKKEGDKKYYLAEDGKMVTGTVELEGYSHTFGQSGNLIAEAQLLKVDGNVNPEMVALYDKEIKKVPYDIRKYVKEFIIIDELLAQRFHVYTPTLIAGTFKQGNVYFASDKFRDYVPLHECLHAFDYGKLNNDTALSDTPEFMAAYNADFNSIPFNGTINVREAFSECGVLYLRNPEELLKTCPNIYTYLKDIAFADIDLTN